MIKDNRLLMSNRWFLFVRYRKITNVPAFNELSDKLRVAVMYRLKCEVEGGMFD